MWNRRAYISFVYFLPLNYILLYLQVIVINGIWRIPYADLSSFFQANIKLLHKHNILYIIKQNYEIYVISVIFLGFFYKLNGLHLPFRVVGFCCFTCNNLSKLIGIVLSVSRRFDVALWRQKKLTVFSDVANFFPPNLLSPPPHKNNQML